MPTTKLRYIQYAAYSFRATGIWPWNPNGFSDADFMASTVTNPDDFEGNSMEPIREVSNETTTADAQSPQSS